MLGMKPGWCWTEVAWDADFLGSEMENKGPFMGMKGPQERGEPKLNDPSTFLIPYQWLDVPGLFSWVNFSAMLLN